MSERAAIERVLSAEHRRLWALCYRMTGSRSDADDLVQDASARAIEKASQATRDDPTGWVLRLTARACIDHLRRGKSARRANQLVDPLHGDEWTVGSLHAPAPDDALVLREDLRFAVVVALQRLPARQRLALVLHDVCDRPLDDIAEVLGTRASAAKAVLHRARAALAAGRVHTDVDVPVDEEVVRRFAAAIAAGDIDALVGLLAPDVWGVTDGGGVVKTATRPNHGRRAVGRQWANAKRKLPLPVTTELVRVNGERAIVIALASAPDVVVALVMLESRAGEVAALRVSRDPRVTTTSVDSACPLRRLIRPSERTRRSPMSDAPIASSIALLVSLVVAVAAIEAVVPFATRARDMGRVRTNLSLTVLTFALQLALGAATAAALAHTGPRVGLLAGLGVPPVAAAIVSLVVLDGCTYLAHRLMHAVPALWRFHRVHHADRFVDVTTTYRFHPLEAAWRFVWTFGPALVLGVAPTVFVAYRLLSAINGLLEHANVRVPRTLDAWIALAWVTPRMHKLHHSVRATETDTNYGNLLSLFDRLLGTFTPTERADAVVYGLGASSGHEPSTLAAMLRWPFASDVAPRVVEPPARRETT